MDHPLPTPPPVLRGHILGLMYYRRFHMVFYTWTRSIYSQQKIINQMCILTRSGSQSHTRRPKEQPRHSYIWHISITWTSMSQSLEQHWMWQVYKEITSSNFPLLGESIPKNDKLFRSNWTLSSWTSLLIFTQLFCFNFWVCAWILRRCYEQFNQNPLEL